MSRVRQEDAVMQQIEPQKVCKHMQQEVNKTKTNEYQQSCLKCKEIIYRWKN